MAKKKTARSLPVHEQIFQLHVSLVDTDPLVWRRILVPGFFTLEKLHSVLQIVMGWRMCHLYDFTIGDSRYAEPDEFDETPVKSLAASISGALQNKKSFTYNYDFGDDWRHDVLVEAVTGREDGLAYPICIGGENACPPEDCLGTHGYEELKKKIADPKDPGHDETMAWLGGFFDPKAFDPNRINRDMLWTIDWMAEPNDQGLYIPFSKFHAEEKGRDH